MSTATILRTYGRTCAALVKAVHETPRDAAARSALADWFTEHGHVWAAHAVVRSVCGKCFHPDGEEETAHDCVANRHVDKQTVTAMTYEERAERWGERQRGGDWGVLVAFKGGPCEPVEFQGV